MKHAAVVIDGVKVSGPPGMTILEAADKAHIEIPRLCHEEGIKPSGNCRICVVEVEGARTLVGACHTPIAEGMTIRTNSARVLEARRATIELLLAGHTGSCVTDAEARECSLHKLASDLEAGPPRFRVKSPRLYEVENASPYILRDMSRCILCRKCIRACREVAGQNVYAMAYRGFGSKVVVDCDVPLNKEVCKDCGVCIEYCPTSALMWPEGVKKREGRQRKEVPKPAPENGARERLLDLLKARQRTDGVLSEASLSEIAVRPQASPRRGLRRRELLRLSLYEASRQERDQGMQERALLSEERPHDRRDRIPDDRHQARARPPPTRGSLSS